MKCTELSLNNGTKSDYTESSRYINASVQANCSDGYAFLSQARQQDDYVFYFNKSFSCLYNNVTDSVYWASTTDLGECVGKSLFYYIFCSRCRCMVV